MYTLSRNRLTTLVLLIALSLAMLFFHQTGYLQPIEDLALGWLQPVLGGTFSAGKGAAAATGTFADVNALRVQIAQLQSQVDAMTLDSVRLRELESENKTLREQLAYQQAHADYDLAGAGILQRILPGIPDAAFVIGLEPSSLVSYVIVDQGSEEGVKPAMPVVTPQGLVGRVTQVGSHWAKVLLITDPSSSVNAVVQSTRATGIVQGDVNGKLIIKYVPQGEAIRTGDLILTSGMGGNFPKRLVIGQVTEVRKRDIELFQEATIQPTVDFLRLEFVLILKKFTPSDIASEPTPTPTRAPTPTRTPTPSP